MTKRNEKRLRARKVGPSRTYAAQLVLSRQGFAQRPCLQMAGLFGKSTSKAPEKPLPLPLQTIAYKGLATKIARSQNVLKMPLVSCEELAAQFQPSPVYSNQWPNCIKKVWWF